MIVPAALLERPQWVLWRYEPRADGKPAKIPINAETGFPASVADPGHWTSFEVAQAALERDEDEGLGFVFTAEDPFIGIDLDNVRDPSTGAVDSSAESLIRELNSYAEVSPSGTGIKIWVKGRLPIQETGKRTTLNGQGGIEIYQSRRYFTFTGQHLPGTPESVEDRTTEVNTLWRKYFGEAIPVAQPGSKFRPQLGGGDAIEVEPDLGDDEAVLRAAFSAENGPKFTRLWAGNWEGYPSQSEADLALCCLLIFNVGHKPARVDRLFRQSKLMREKWDEPRGDSTYGKLTIRDALDKQGPVRARPRVKAKSKNITPDVANPLKPLRQ